MLIASSSTFHPHLDLGLSAVYPGFSDQQRCQCSTSFCSVTVSACTGVGRGSHKQSAIDNRVCDIKSLMWDEWSYPWLLLEMTILPLCQFRLQPISKWPPTEFRPNFFEVGPLKMFSLTYNEMNKTIKPWSPFPGHGS